MRVLFVVEKQFDAEVLSRMLPDPHMAIGLGASLCGQGFDEIIVAVPRPYTEQVAGWLNQAVRTRLMPRGIMHE
jgi:hypothetical protein